MTPATNSSDGPVDPGLLEKLFSQLPDVVFFTKDRLGRYARVNDTLLNGCGIKDRAKLLGLTAEQVFPKPLGASYAAQDQLVIREGIEIRDRLELHLYPGGGRGWSLTFKTPLYSGKTITGLLGISPDLHRPDEFDAGYRRLARAIRPPQAPPAAEVRPRVPANDGALA